MPIRASRRALLAFLFLALAGAFAACHTAGGASVDANRWTGKTVYTRVGMRVEPAKKVAGWHMYSTNHVGLPKFIPAGSKFTFRDFGRNRANLVGEDGALVELEYVTRHHPDLTFDTWLERQLSETPTELPGDLSDKEKEAVAAGRYEVGMSRAALFLAIGYPPRALTPGLNDAQLTYEVRRFNRVIFQFDAEGRLSAIQH
jgi:hypothetical protein